MALLFCHLKLVLILILLEVTQITAVLFGMSFVAVLILILLEVTQIPIKSYGKK